MLAVMVSLAASCLITTARLKSTTMYPQIEIVVGSKSALDLLSQVGRMSTSVTRRRGFASLPDKNQSWKFVSTIKDP